MMSSLAPSSLQPMHFFDLNISKVQKKNITIKKLTPPFNKSSVSLSKTTQIQNIIKIIKTKTNFSKNNVFKQNYITHKTYNLEIMY